MKIEKIIESKDCEKHNLKRRHRTKAYRDMQHFPMSRFRVNRKHYYKARFKKQMLRFYERM